jgi:hypothetical protein
LATEGVVNDGRGIPNLVAVEMVIVLTWLDVIFHVANIIAANILGIIWQRASLVIDLLHHLIEERLFRPLLLRFCEVRYTLDGVGAVIKQALTLNIFWEPVCDVSDERGVLEFVLSKSTFGIPVEEPVAHLTELLRLSCTHPVGE